MPDVREGRTGDEAGLPTGLMLVGRIPRIGSSDGDCAPPPSHTTGRAVFRIRRLNQRHFT